MTETMTVMEVLAFAMVVHHSIRNQMMTMTVGVIEKKMMAS